MGLGLGLGLWWPTKSSLIAGLIASLRARSTYFENENCTKATLQDLDDVNLLEKASIITTPTAYSDGKLHSVKPVQTLGNEDVVNGDFATDSNWVKQNGWNISEGAANYNGVSSVYIQQANVFTANTNYKITFTISNNTSGIISFRDGTASTLIPNTNYSNGIYTFYVTSNTNTPLRIYGASGSGS